MRLRIENALIERQLHRTEAARVKALHNCVDSVAEHANTMASVTSHLGDQNQSLFNPATDCVQRIDWF